MSKKIQSAEMKGIQFYKRKNGTYTQFPFRHVNRIYWFKVDIEKLNKALETLAQDGSTKTNKSESNDQILRSCITISQLCNARIKPLYFQKNITTDESWYFVKITTQNGVVKSTFTGEQLSSPAKFKPRLLSTCSGVLWTGNTAQLDSCLKISIGNLKEVQTIDYIGYSRDLRAYIFNKVAFFKGEIFKINHHDYYKFESFEAKSLAKSPDIKINVNIPFIPDWYPKFWRIRGANGLIVLAWWLGSYFAEQIRSFDGSFPFLEVIGDVGAGKSRLIEFLWKLSGRQNYEGFNPNKSTSAGLYRNFAQVSNLPVVLIEGDKESTDNKYTKQAFDWDDLKDAFNGRSIRTRGVKTAGNETYEPPFRGAIMISQNAEIQASEAIISRSNHIKMDRKGQTLESKRIVDELDQIKIETASTFIAHCLQNEEPILATYRTKVRKYESEYHANGVTHTRIALNHAQNAAMVDALAMHVLNDVIDLEHVIEANALLLSMAHKRVQRLSSDHILIVQFWDVYDYLVGSGNMSINHAKHTNTIAINLNEFYRIASEERQSLPDINQLKRLLPSSHRRKFIESNKSVRSATRLTNVSEPILKCWIFQKPMGDI